MSTTSTFRTPVSRLLGVALVSTLACNKQSSAPPLSPEPAPPPAQEVAKAPERLYPEPPAATEPKPVNFPEIQEFRTENGIQVYVVENHEVPIVSAELVVRAGTMDDQFLADFAAQMLGEGTKKRTKAQIDEAIESVGGNLGVGAGIHVTTMSSRVLKRDLKLAFELMADEIMNPTFPAAALEKLKKQAKTALESAKAQPATLAATLFGMVAYPEGHPYGRPFATPEQIDAVKVEDVQKFHKTFYHANNSFLILAGDVTRADVEPMVKAAFGKWKWIEKKDLPPNPLNAFVNAYGTAKTALVVHLVDRPESAQADIIVGNLSIARKHEDWIKFAVANSLLGGGASGRLFNDIREKRSLTYGIYSSVSAAQGPGAFTISTKTRTKTVGDMMRGIFEHVEMIRNTEPTPVEFETTVKKMIGSFALEIETADQISGKVNTQLVFGLKPDYWRTYRDGIAATSSADVKAVASKFVHQNPLIVIVGKADKIEPQIKDVLPNAKVVLYDTDLKPKK